MATLKVDQALSATAQSVKDQNGNTSSLALSTDGVGIGTTTPDASLTLQSTTGDVLTTKDHNGDSRFAFHSHHAVPFFHELKSSNYDLRLSSFLAGGSGGNIEFLTGTATASERVRIDSNGNVGIGVKAPQRTLHIAGGLCIEASGITPGLFGWQVALRPRGDTTFLGFAEDTKPNHNGSWRMVIVKGGNVGIGTITPTEKLQVNGNILATGDVRLSGEDCAEHFDVAEAHALEPGTVMVIGDEETLHECAEAYDGRVAGVISGAGNCKPGILLGSKHAKSKRMPLALMGKVYCKVDAQYSPISVGDLLTTSPSPGHAMKATDAFKAFGAVIGKALRPLTEGRGLIPILIALQ